MMAEEGCSRVGLSIPRNRWSIGGEQGAITILANLLTLYSPLQYLYFLTVFFDIQVYFIFSKKLQVKDAGSMFKACQKFRLPTCVHFASHCPSGATLGSSVAGQHGLHGLHQPRQDSLENKKSEKVSAAAHQVQPCDVSAHGRLPAALPEGPLAAGGVGGGAGGEGGGEGGGGEARPGDGGQEEAAHGIL